ncbi:MAG TPA: Calx-beta domain-containing protein [Pyrinomonadaceae bacterium]|nr:Calx-beta domain-containing protein [Pyrinomonadaceae bacterium]
MWYRGFSSKFTNKNRWLIALGLLIGITGLAASWPVAAPLAQSKTNVTPETTTRWAPVGFGLNGIVRNILVNGTDLYAVGDFTAICGNPTCDSGNIPAHRAAKWDGTQWSPLGFGIGGSGTMVFHDNKLYVAGVTLLCADAACSTTTNIQGIAMWDGASWSNPFPPLISTTHCCRTLAFVGNDVYVGGDGLINGGVNPEDFACAIARLSNGAWVPIPGGGLQYKASPTFTPRCTAGGTDAGASVTTLLSLGNDLYVGGFFTQSGSDDSGVLDLNNMAVLKGLTTWQPVPGKGLIADPNANGTQTGSVNALGLIGTDVYAAGGFTHTKDGSLTLNNIARLSSGAFFATPNNGLNGQITKFAIRGNDLFAVGSFTATADGAVTGLGKQLDGVAWLSNGAWSPLGNGFQWSGHSAGAVLLDIAASNDQTYVGGGFTQNGDNSAPGLNNIAQLLPVATTQLQITKTANPNPAIAGENLTYTIVIKNQGPDTAKAVTLTDPLAANVTFASASSTQGNCSQSNGSVVCNLGDVAIGASVTATIVVVPNAAGTILNLATASAANANPVQGQANTTVSPSTGTVQFNATALSVNEGDQRANVTVTRSGDTTAAATVNYATSDTAGSSRCDVFNGAASSRCDYLATLGTLHFAAGETSKTISIPIVDDGYAEGNENFTLSLSNALGNGLGLGSQSAISITIIDNDAVNGANPVDNSRSFVRFHYLDFLNREPDQSGWDFWTNNINNCTPQPSCTDVQRINTSGAFFLSIEFQQTGYLVERIYKTAFGDGSGSSTIGGAHTLTVPVVRLNEFLLDTQQIGQGVVVLQPGWETLLENNKQAYALDFVQRSRFATAFPTTLTPTQFVNQLFANAGVTPSSSDRNAAINEFAAASDTSNVSARSRALRDVAENSLLQQQEFNRAFVLMQYFGYLRRNPNDLPDADYTGFDFWLTKLNQFNGNYQNAEMVKAFITSPEYRGRFGP